MTDLPVFPWQPIEAAESMLVLLLFHPYYSHGQCRQGYRNKAGEWIGVNADGTEKELNFVPTRWTYLPKPAY